MTGMLELTSYNDLINHPELDFASSKLLKKIFTGSNDQEKKLLKDLHSIIHKQENRIARQQILIRKLQVQLSLNSHNSSKPPSTDSPFQKKVIIKSEREESYKKPGGQKKHTGKTLKQVLNPDYKVLHNVFICKKCRSNLPYKPLKILRRQVFEICEPNIKVTEHQVHVKKCLHCKTVNRLPFPTDIKARVQYGNRIKKRISYLFVNHYIPYERVTDYFYDIYGHKISEGTVNNALREEYFGLEGWDKETKRNIIDSEVVHFDESGMRESGQTKWIHVASTKDLTYYRIHENRGKIATDEIGILPKFKGFAVHDGYKTYFKYRKAKHVLCNAHHIRELRSIYESGGIESKYANQMRILLKHMNHVVKKAKENGKDRLEEKQIKNLRRIYGLILRRWNASYKKYFDVEVNQKQYSLFHGENQPPPYMEGERKQSKGKNLFDRLKKYRENILGFLSDFRIPFDNNLAERDIRMVKLKQKISGTFRTSMGGKIFCRIRSFISTMRKQGYRYFEAIELVR